RTRPLEVEQPATAGTLRRRPHRPGGPDPEPGGTVRRAGEPLPAGVALAAHRRGHRAVSLEFPGPRVARRDRAAGRPAEDRDPGCTPPIRTTLRRWRR